MQPCFGFCSIMSMISKTLALLWLPYGTKILLHHLVLMTKPYGHLISYVMTLLMTKMKMAKVPMTRRRLSEMRRIRVKPEGEKPQLWNWAKLAAKLCVNSGLVKPFLRLLAENSSTPKLKKYSTFLTQLCCFLPQQRMSII